MATLEFVREVKSAALKSLKSAPIQYDVSTRAGKTALQKTLDYGDKQADVHDFSSIQDYATIGATPAVTHGKNPIFSLDGKALVVNDGVVLSSGYSHFPMLGMSSGAHTASKGFKKCLKREEIVGVLAKPHGESQSAYHRFLIRNGDEDRNLLVEELSNEWPTVSFECLGQFFAKRNETNSVISANLLASGKLVVVAFSEDDKIKLTKAEQKLRSKANRSNVPSDGPKPPTGYTLVNNDWHRSATVVVRDTRKGGSTYLLGQDESVYFGCELRDHPTSVQEAYDSLVPDEVKGKAFNRHGEWFVVSVAEKDVPKLEDCLMMFGPPDHNAGQSTGWPHHKVIGELALPIQEDGSAYHWIQPSEGRIGKDGTVYAFDGKLVHSNNDHTDVEYQGWVTFYRNTAKRSVSTQGVD